MMANTAPIPLKSIEDGSFISTFSKENLNCVSHSLNEEDTSLQANVARIIRMISRIPEE